MDRFSFFRQLGEAVYRIDGAYNVFSKNAGISLSMLWLLSALNDGREHTQSQICWDWNYPKTTVNTLVKELERDGYVTLSPVPDTRRELYVKLTEQGQAYASQVLEPVYRAEQALFETYFDQFDPSFVIQLHRFSTVMKQFFATGQFEERGGEGI